MDDEYRLSGEDSSKTKRKIVGHALLAPEEELFICKSKDTVKDDRYSFLLNEIEGWQKETK